MTKNTEKVATWFADTFRDYGWDVNLYRITSQKKLVEDQESLYFDDYDCVFLGSPIVGGSPLQSVIKALSLGAGGGLEKEVQDKIDAHEKDAAAGAKKPGILWRRNQAPYAGVLNPEDSIPLGVVFTTYGGGFFGSSEAMATLEQLKLYLQTNNVHVVGKFACGGKETGPAGFPVGEKPPKFFRPGPKDPNAPKADVQDAVYYRMGDGSLKPGSYFFHYDCDSKPGPREEAKAKAFAADLIEDYFMSYNNKTMKDWSELISIS